MWLPPELEPFVRALLDKCAAAIRKDPSRPPDPWNHLEVDYIRRRLAEEIAEWDAAVEGQKSGASDIYDERLELVDITAFCWFLFLRLGRLSPPATWQNRPTVVTLCGSVRFPEDWARATEEETLAGRIVLAVGCFDHARFHRPEGKELKRQMDELHKRKIDLSDEILVVTEHIGESTRSEIDYAVAHGKRVRYLEEPGRSK